MFCQLCFVTSSQSPAKLRKILFSTRAKTARSSCQINQRVIRHFKNWLKKQTKMAVLVDLIQLLYFWRKKRSRAVYCEAHPTPLPPLPGRVDQSLKNDGGEGIEGR